MKSSSGCLLPKTFAWYSTNDLDSIDPDDASLITIGYRITYSQFELKIEIAETWVYGNNDGKKPIVTSENPTGNEVVFTYYKQNESGEYVSVGNTLPKDVGSYRVSASVENGNNYSGVFNEEVYFTITPRTVTVEISVSDDTYGSWSGA